MRIFYLCSRNRTHISSISYTGRWVFSTSATREVHSFMYSTFNRYLCVDNKFRILIYYFQSAPGLATKLTIIKMNSKVRGQ